MSFFKSLNFAANVVFGILILAYFGMRSFWDTVSWSVYCTGNASQWFLFYVFIFLYVFNL